MHTTFLRFSLLGLICLFSVPLVAMGTQAPGLIDHQAPAIIAVSDCDTDAIMQEQEMLDSAVAGNVTFYIVSDAETGMAWLVIEQLADGTLSLSDITGRTQITKRAPAQFVISRDTFMIEKPASAGAAVWRA